jgi:FSR family fosmidomycin resistance protein-like MFS transporter
LQSLGLLPLFILAHFFHHLLVAMLVPLLPFMRNDLAFDYTQAGWLLSAFTLAYGFSQVPAGWLSDRIGSRILITIGISGVALAGLLVGLSPTHAILIVFLILMGTAGGGYHPAAAPLVSATVQPRNRGRALGFHQIGGTSSYFLAPLVTAALASALGWRNTIISVAIPTIALGIALYTLLGRLRPSGKAEPVKAAAGVETPLPSGYWRLLVAFITLSIVGHILIYSTISFVPLFLVDRFGMSEEAAAGLLALTYSGGLWGGPLGGYLSDRLGTIPVLLSATLFAAPVIFLLNLVPSGFFLSLLLTGIGMSVYLRMPASEYYIISQASERQRSMILGIYYFASRGGPGVLMPVLGYLFDHYGFYVGLSAVSIALVVITFGCVGFLRGSPSRPSPT